MGEKLQPISSYFHALIQHKSEWKLVKLAQSVMNEGEARLKFLGHRFKSGKIGLKMSFMKQTLFSRICTSAPTL
jgi:hypothetical protein